MTWKLLEANLVANLIPVFIFAGAIWILKRSQREAIWREAARRLRKNRLALGAMFVLALFSGVVFLDSISWRPTLASDPVTAIDAIFKRPDERTYSAPFADATTGEATSHPVLAKHALGTDEIGADVFYKVLKGTRTSFLIGGLSCLIAVPLGVILGLLAGYFGKWVDDIIQYLYTLFGSIPDILLIIAIVLLCGKGLTSICGALGVTSWIGLCRLVRGETLKHRDREYVRAAKALGVSDVRILAKHILPNLLPAIIIAVTLLFSTLALYETILSYLGVGMKPTDGSWGNMINNSRSELTRDPSIWWSLTFSAGALLLLVLCLNILADALRDAIDTRLRTT